MASISINNDFTIPQPSGIKEEIIRHVHDRVSIKGVQRRIWMADKHRVELTWEAITLAQYNQLAAYLFNQGNSVTYTNAVSGVSFIGFPNHSTDNFIRGNSWIRNFSAQILEV